jgi:RimJ/RimL family protein N-acetyltransferase
MELVLERCTIRAWHPDDAASLAKHANNRRVWLGLRDLFPHPYIAYREAIARRYLWHEFGDLNLIL